MTSVITNAQVGNSFPLNSRPLVEQVPDPEQRKRLKVFAGDITQRDLGLEAPVRDELKQRVTHVIHLAALYNLSTPRDTSMRVNVDETRHLLDFISEFPSLARLAYASTIAVSGKNTRMFREDDLDLGQDFQNNYDETKFLSRSGCASVATTFPA